MVKSLRGKLRPTHTRTNIKSVLFWFYRKSSFYFILCVGHHQTCGGPVSCRREILFQMLRPQTGPHTVQGVVLAPQQSVHVPGQTEVRVVSPPRGMEVTAHNIHSETRSYVLSYCYISMLIRTKLASSS